MTPYQVRYKISDESDNQKPSYCHSLLLNHFQNAPKEKKRQLFILGTQDVKHFHYYSILRAYTRGHACMMSPKLKINVVAMPLPWKTFKKREKVEIDRGINVVR